MTFFFFRNESSDGWDSGTNIWSVEVKQKREKRKRGFLFFTSIRNFQFRKYILTSPKIRNDLFIYTHMRGLRLEIFTIVYFSSNVSSQHSICDPP